MAIWKFGDYQAYTSATHRGDVKPAEVVKNGYIGKFNPVTKQFEKYASVAEAQAETWIVGNIIDKPELDNTDDYEVKTTEYARIFKLNDVVGKQIEIQSTICSTAFASVAVGDVLLPQTASYQVKKKSTETGTYGVALIVKKINTLGNFTIDGAGNGGYVCEVAKVTY